MTGEQMDQEWAALSVLGAEQREARMIERCTTVAALDDDARAAALSAMVRAEYSLPPAELPPFTLSRLRAWITIERTDRDLATRLARGYDTAFQTMPADMAMRRSSVVQGVARNDLSSDEIEMLFELIPSIVQQVPRIRQDSLTSRPHQPTPEPKSKPWWRFW